MPRIPRARATVSTTQIIERGKIQLLEFLAGERVSPENINAILDNTDTMNEFRSLYLEHHEHNSIEDIAWAVRAIGDIIYATRNNIERGFQSGNHYLHRGQIVGGVGVVHPDLNSNIYDRLSEMIRDGVISQPTVRFDTSEAMSSQDNPVSEVAQSESRAVEVDVDLNSIFFETPKYASYSRPSASQRNQRPRRSEREMAHYTTKDESFPRPNFEDWDSRDELESLIDNWCEHIEYRDNWIFARREREGFNRRNIEYFTLDEIQARIDKRKQVHHLDTESSKFYDWKLGGTNWILRLELVTVKDVTFLISRYIHKDTGKEVRYDVRYWKGGKFERIIALWSEHHNNAQLISRNFDKTDQDLELEEEGYYSDSYDGDDEFFDDFPMIDEDDDYSEEEEDSF